MERIVTLDTTIKRRLIVSFDGQTGKRVPEFWAGWQDKEFKNQSRDQLIIGLVNLISQEKNHQTLAHQIWQPRHPPGWFAIFCSSCQPLSRSLHPAAYIEQALYMRNKLSRSNRNIFSSVSNRIHFARLATGILPRQFSQSITFNWFLPWTVMEIVAVKSWPIRLIARQV